MTLKVHVKSLNETILNDLAVGELESRLKEESLDATTEMWAGCDVNFPCWLFPCSMLAPCPYLCGGVLD